MRQPTIEIALPLRVSLNLNEGRRITYDVVDDLSDIVCQVPVFTDAQIPYAMKQASWIADAITAAITGNKA